MADQEQADPGTTGADPAMDAGAEEAAFNELADAADAKQSGKKAETAAVVTDEDDALNTEESPEDKAAREEASAQAEAEKAEKKEKEDAEKAEAEADKSAAAFWTAVSAVHPRAEKDTTDPRFTRFVESDKRIERMSRSHSPDVAIELLNAYYEARDAGELDGPAPKKETQAATEKKEVSEKTTTPAAETPSIDDLKVIVHDGTEMTLKELAEKEAAEGEDVPYIDGRQTAKLIKEAVALAMSAAKPAAPVDANELKALKEQLGHMTFWQQLEDAHPGARKTVNTPECKAFVAKQPPSIQRLYRSNNPEDVAYVVDLYEKSLEKETTTAAKTAATEKKKRRDALHSETVRGRQSRPADAGSQIPDDAEHEDELFEEQAAIAEKRAAEKRKARLR